MKVFPIFPAIFLVFLTLKLAEIGTVATWSWWLVTAPLWGPLVVLIVGAALFLVGLLIWKAATA